MVTWMKFRLHPDDFQHRAYVWPIIDQGEVEAACSREFNFNRDALMKLVVDRARIVRARDREGAGIHRQRDACA